MKIGIMTDMEGVAGVMNRDDWTLPDGVYYERGKQFLTEETNAAIGGFFAAGASEIVVIDGHGAGGVDPWLLDERATLSRGWGTYHQFGLDDGFDALAWVGQHAKSGSLFAHIAHTGSHDVLENKINGVSMGEFGECAAIGGFYGTPAIFGSGDRAFAEEAKALVPHIHTVSVKRGVNQTGGDECDAEAYGGYTLGALHMHPKCARALIFAAAKEALESFAGDRTKYPPLRIEPPYVLETWFRANKNGPAQKITRRHHSDIVAMYASPAQKGFL